MAGAAVADYPVASEVDVALRDGSSMHLRPVRAGDGIKVHAFLEALSEDSLALRFFGIPNLEWVERWSLAVDYADSFGLVATTGSAEEIIAHGAYIREREGRAEVAFMVADAWQGHGIATIMLGHLAATAALHGIAQFTAVVIPSNHRMIEVFRRSGFPVQLRSSSGLIEVEFPTSLSPLSLERFERREQTAAIAAVQPFLRPRTVAVIGAQWGRASPGGELLHHLISDGFTGAVYPVDEGGGTVQGHPAYATIGDVPERVDLAVLTLPAAHVADMARGCGAAGVRALLVISDGFAETGGGGRRRQHQLLGACRESGLRLLGPDSLGVVNTEPDIRLGATYSRRIPQTGRIALMSQSAGLGIAILEAADQLGLGISSFVSVGDKADISGNDLLEFWEADPGTDLILLYLKSVGNPRRFARITRRVGASKPIVMLKTGHLLAPPAAATSEAAKLIRASDLTVDALFTQTGVIRANTMRELLDVAALLSSQPIPGGGRVAIVTNSRGAGTLCAEACARDELTVIEPGPALRKRLTHVLGPAASFGTSIDLSKAASAEDYRGAIEMLVQEGVCDSLIVIFVPSLAAVAHDVFRVVQRAAGVTEGITVATVLLDPEPLLPDSAAGASAVPAFAFPEDAARCVAHAVRHSEWRSLNSCPAPPLDDCRPDEAAAIIATALLRGANWLDRQSIIDLFACYGLPLASARVARGIGQAVVKAGHAPDRLVVRSIAEAGDELFLGLVNDESLGPVVVCATGATSGELPEDVSIRITPLTPLDAHEMVRALRTCPPGNGRRGTAAWDIGSVTNVLLRLSALAEGHPEVVELDATPVVVRPEGVTIVDARVRVQAATPHPLSALRT
ncbi:MAG: GNAT family N-acetyltransferase [Solirubrobacteraceae bacterium]